MLQKLTLSPAEHKILLGLALFVCILFYLHLSNSLIETHNAWVKEAQIEKQRAANGNVQTSMFSNCAIPPPLYLYLFWIQFYTAPLSYFLLRKQKFGRFAISCFLTAITTLSLWAWNERAYSNYLWSTQWLQKDAYFFVTSHFLALILAIFSSVFLVLQFFFIARFAAEKFQAKISLR